MEENEKCLRPLKNGFVNVDCFYAFNLQIYISLHSLATVTQWILSDCLKYFTLYLCQCLTCVSFKSPLFFIFFHQTLTTQRNINLIYKDNYNLIRLACYSTYTFRNLSGVQKMTKTFFKILQQMLQNFQLVFDHLVGTKPFRVKALLHEIHM